MLYRHAGEAFWTALGPHRHLALYYLYEAEPVESMTPQQQRVARGGVRPLVLDSLGPPPARAACTDAYDNSLFPWRWVDAVALSAASFPRTLAGLDVPTARWRL